MPSRAFLEVGPLFERQWTGIAKVTAGIARQALGDPQIDWTFFFQSVALPRACVVKLIEQRSGAGGFDFLAEHLWSKADIAFDEARTGRALFTNIKTVRGLFADEAIFVHDLSTLLTPQFHEPGTIAFFADHIRYDIETSSRFFCNSRATRDDLVTYLAVDPAAATVVPMGVDIDPADLSAAQLAAERVAVEPYIVVLATLEPRKNAAIVLRFLARNPDFARRFRIVFIGRSGWLDERQRLLDEIESAGLPADRVLFTGYAGECEKTVLLFNAAFCVYASMFEGFGLPILEAAALGKIIACSDSSSMPEAAPDQCCFFDPTDDAAFASAMLEAEQRARRLRSPMSFADVASRLAPLGWERCYRLVAEWVKS